MNDGKGEKYLQKSWQENKIKITLKTVQVSKGRRDEKWKQNNKIDKIKT